MTKPRVYDIHNASIYFNWGWDGIGFGELWVGKSKEGQLVIDDECMGKERTRELLYALVDKLVDEAEFR